MDGLLRELSTSTSSYGRSTKGTIYKYININLEVRLGLPFSILPIHGKEAMNAFTEAVNPNASNWEDTMRHYGFPTDFAWDEVACSIVLRKEQSFYSAVNTHFPQWVNDIWKREYPDVYEDVCSLEFALQAQQWEVAASILNRLDNFQNPKADRHFVAQKRYQRPI